MVRGFVLKKFGVWGGGLNNFSHSCLSEYFFLRSSEKSVSSASYNKAAFFLSFLLLSTCWQVSKHMWLILNTFLKSAATSESPRLLCTTGSQPLFQKLHCRGSTPSVIHEDVWHSQVSSPLLGVRVSEADCAVLFFIFHTQLNFWLRLSLYWDGAIDRMFVSPTPKFLRWILTSNMLYWEVEPLGDVRSLGWGPSMGLVPLYMRPQSASFHLVKTVRRLPCMNRQDGSLQTPNLPMMPLILDFPASINRRNK